jgi:hypothetical protein
MSSPLIRGLAWLGIIVCMTTALMPRLPAPVRILSAVLVVMLVIVTLRGQPEP